MTTYSAKGHGTNALLRVVFIVQFAEEFSSQDFERFDEASKSWREVLPRRSVSNAVLLQPNSHRVAFDEEKIVGLTYEALAKDGEVEFGLRFDGSRILFVASRYSHWRNIWSQAKGLLEMALDLVSDDNLVVSYATEYSDLFRATGNYFDFDAKEILRTDSRFIPSHVFERTENFHFHTGFFETLDEPAQHRVLTRINADLRDNTDERARDLSIVLFHQMSPPHKPWTGNAQLPKEVLNRGLRNFETLHDVDKRMLLELLNDDMSQSIGLA